jgi:hypothetical protein
MQSPSTLASLAQIAHSERSWRLTNSIWSAFSNGIQRPLDNVPRYKGINVLILVAQEVSEAGNLPPWYIRMLRLEFSGDRAARFRNYLQATLCGAAQ